jgi:hypothetical protein
MALTCDTNDLEAFYYHQKSGDLVSALHFTGLLKLEVFFRLTILQFVNNTNHNMALRPLESVGSIRLSNTSNMGLFARAIPVEGHLYFVVCQ